MEEAMEKSSKTLTRRNFIKSAAIGTGAAVLLGPLGGNAIAATPKIPKRWDLTTDVIVIGFGGAGAAAAIEAHDAGAKVLILEKTQIAGGSTTLSGGIVYAAGTSVQQKAGIKDSADGMYKYWMAVNNDLVDPEITKYLSDNSADVIDWLTKLGVEFRPEDLYLSGLESQFASITPAVKRGHLAKGRGGAIMSALVKAVNQRKIPVRYKVAAESLIVNPAGEVIGLKANSGGKKINIKAKRGVMIASGGMSRNRNLTKKYFPMHLAAVPVSGLGSQGDGIIMAQKIGAPIITGAIDPPDALPGVEIEKGKFVKMLSYPHFFYKYPSVMVNEKGRRFMDETEYYMTSNPRILKQKKAYIIYDKRGAGGGETIGYGFSKGLKEEFASGAIKTAQTIPELAKLVGLNPDELAKTVEKYNKAAASGSDEEFNKKKALLPLDNPPYYICSAGVSLVLFLAGLSHNIKAQVLDPYDKPIPRLYSAGEATWVFAAYPASGAMLINCFVWGRVAGRNLAALKPVA